jgi:hypothetical protein
MLGCDVDPPGADDDRLTCRTFASAIPARVHPAAIRAVLAANAVPEVLLRYDNELDRAFEEARERGDLTPLVRTVRRWWFEADA